MALPRIKAQLPVPEKNFRQAVVDLARWRQWRVYFTWNSLHSPAGFPDMVMVRRGRLIFAELESAKGKLTPEQEIWIQELKNVKGIEVYTWEPSQFDEVVKVLR